MTIFHLIKHPDPNLSDEFSQLPLWVKSQYMDWINAWFKSGPQNHKFGPEREQKLRDLLLEYDPDLHDYQ